MKYMVIETFRPGMTDRVYARFREKGRMLPAGVVYIDSWLSRDRTRCFQLMSADRPEVLQEWMSRWNDLVDFEVVPVQDSPTITKPLPTSPVLARGPAPYRAKPLHSKTEHRRKRTCLPNKR